MAHQLVAREATLSDVAYLVRADLQVEGYSPGDAPDMTKQELEEHQAKIGSFVTDPNKSTWVLEDSQVKSLAGMIMFRFRNRVEPLEQPDSWLFRELPVDIFPPDGRFCEVFNLRVEPQYRRQGYATLLKGQMELVARQRQVGLLYTHTEQTNVHVLKLNHQLGYRQVRCGPIWDDVLRVSLVKRLLK